MWTPLLSLSGSPEFSETPYYQLHSHGPKSRVGDDHYGVGVSPSWSCVISSSFPVHYSSTFGYSTHAQYLALYTIFYRECVCFWCYMLDTWEPGFLQQIDLYNIWVRSGGLGWVSSEEALLGPILHWSNPGCVACTWSVVDIGIFLRSYPQYSSCSGLNIGPNSMNGTINQSCSRGHLSLCSLGKWNFENYDPPVSVSEGRCSL